MRQLQLLDSENTDIGTVADRCFRTVFYLEREGFSKEHIAQALIGFTFMYAKTALEEINFSYLDLIEAYLDAQKEVEHGT